MSGVLRLALTLACTKQYLGGSWEGENGINATGKVVALVQQVPTVPGLHIRMGCCGFYEVESLR